MAASISQSIATRGRAGLRPSLAITAGGYEDASPEDVFQAPLVVNISPASEAHQVSLIQPIAMTVRDEETYVDLAQLDVSVGYAKIHSDGTELFDLLPNTRRLSLLGDADTDGLIDVIDEGLLIAKNSTGPQKTVYATTLDVGAAYKSVMVTAVVRRDLSTVGPLNSAIYPGLNMPPAFDPGSGGDVSEEDEPFSGTVLGLEYGPRGRALYLWLQQTTDDTRLVRLTSYVRDGQATPIVNEMVDIDWGSDTRFTIVWNEADGYVEIYTASGSSTERIFRLPITAFPVMPDDYRRISGVGDVVVVYGQEGSEGSADSRSVWSNIAMTVDANHPIQGSIRMSNFVTQIQGPEFWKVSGAEDPRHLPIGPWFAPSSFLFTNPDSESSARVSIDHFRMTKETLGSTFALFRREPGFAASDTDGFAIQANIEALGVTKEDACTGMGITICDGQSVFQLMLLEDATATRRIGLLRSGGSDADSNGYYTADIDWSESSFRFVVDPRENFIRIFEAEDFETPIFNLPFDRSTLPTAASKGWDDEVPFIAFGHTVPTQSAGIFALHSLVYNHLYQGWAAMDHAPSAAHPAFTLSTTGSPTVGTTNGITTLACDASELAKYSRAAYFSTLRGATVEARVRVTSFRPRFRSGAYLILDDGSRLYALTFVDSYSGKYAALSLRNGTGGFREVVGRDGDGLLYSFPIDWTEFHTYRLERQIFRGFQIYVDGETTPRLDFPDASLALLPNAQFSGVPTVAFGQFSTEGATSEWTYLNTFFSRGYEISTKKNKSDAILRNELYNTQAIVVASASDI